MPRVWTTDDYTNALAARRGGTTLADIGRRYGVSGERARQVIAKAERLERAAAVFAALEKGPNALVSDLPLPVRVANCLNNAGLMECKVAVFFRVTKADLLRVKDFGQKSLSDLLEVLDRFGVELNPARLTQSATEYAARHIVAHDSPLNPYFTRRGGTGRVVTKCGLWMPETVAPDADATDCDDCHAVDAACDQVPR